MRPHCTTNARFPLFFRNCYQNYLDFFRCQHLRGDNYEPCFYFQRAYKTLCPRDWISKWDDQRAEGTFPADLTK